mmetsp:Transcript_105108/g.145366  ORF Transcript_105108/g.145366 Transcript_105108/m.145366 type:complete len:303 (+) Transcript_105108:574-1482(+)
MSSHQVILSSDEFPNAHISDSSAVECFAILRLVFQSLCSILNTIMIFTKLVVTMRQVQACWDLDVSDKLNSCVALGDEFVTAFKKHFQTEKCLVIMPNSFAKISILNTNVSVYAFNIWNSRLLLNSASTIVVDNLFLILCTSSIIKYNLVMWCWHLFTVTFRLSKVFDLLLIISRGIGLINDILLDIFVELIVVLIMYRKLSLVVWLSNLSCLSRILRFLDILVLINLFLLANNFLLFFCLLFSLFIFRLFNFCNFFFLIFLSFWDYLFCGNNFFLNLLLLFSLLLTLILLVILSHLSKFGS